MNIVCFFTYYLVSLQTSPWYSLWSILYIVYVTFGRGSQDKGKLILPGEFHIRLRYLQKSLCLTISPKKSSKEEQKEQRNRNDCIILEFRCRYFLGAVDDYNTWFKEFSGPQKYL